MVESTLCDQPLPLTGFLSYGLPQECLSRASRGVGLAYKEKAMTITKLGTPAVKATSLSTKPGAEVPLGSVELMLADWASKAACRSTDPDALFVQGAAQNRAKTVCLGCPVRTECLADALDNRIEFGVWGGMTERERRSLLRRRPDVKSWWQLLADARREYHVMPGK